MDVAFLNSRKTGDPAMNEAQVLSDEDFLWLARRWMQRNAWSVLTRNNIVSARQFLAITREELRTLQGYSPWRAKDFTALQRLFRTEKAGVSEVVPLGHAFVEEVLKKVSVRAGKVLVENGIWSIQDFLGLTEEQARQFWGCGQKVLKEFERRQQKLQAQLTPAEEKDAALQSEKTDEEPLPETLPTDEAFLALAEAQLGVRAWRTLQAMDITSALVFLSRTEETLRRYRNCSPGVIKQFLALQRVIRSGEASTTDRHVALLSEKMGKGALPEKLPTDEAFLTLAKARLSVRAWNVLQASGITSARMFLGLTKEAALQYRNCGKTTVAEFAVLQQLLRSGEDDVTPKDEGLPTWEKEASWETLFEHLLKAANRQRRAKGFTLTARWRLGLEPGLRAKKTLEAVGLQAGISRERVRHQEKKLRKALQGTLQQLAGPLERLAERVRACLDRPDAGDTALETLAGHLRGNYPWLKEPGEVLPLLRLLRLWDPSLTLGWGVAEGQVYAWWDLRTAFGEAWARLEEICWSRHDAATLMRWRMQQEKTPEWPRIRRLVTLLGGDQKNKVDTSEEAWKALEPDKASREALCMAMKALGEQIDKETSSPHRQELILEALETGPKSLDELVVALADKLAAISYNEVRSAVARLEEHHAIQMVGNKRYALPQRLAPAVVAEAEAFLRAQFERGEVACGFVHQAFLHCRDRLPTGCTEKHFYAMLRDDPAFGLCAENYPAVSLREGLTTRTAKDEDNFWTHIGARLTRELPIHITRMGDIWRDWFGGNPEQMADKLRRHFCLKTCLRADGTRWYDRVEPRA